MAEGRDKEKGKAESKGRETDSWEEHCDKKEGKAHKWEGKQKIEGAPGSSTDKPPMRNKEEYLKEVDENKEVQDLYSKKQWLQENIQKVEKEIEHIKQQQQGQGHTDAVTISTNTQSDGDTTQSDREEKWKLIDRAASWTTKKSKQKEKRKSRYDNPKIELTNRFQVLQRKSGSGGESGDQSTNKKRKEDENGHRYGKADAAYKMGNWAEAKNKETKRKETDMGRTEMTQRKFSPKGNREGMKERENKETESDEVRFESGKTAEVKYEVGKKEKTGQEGPEKDNEKEDKKVVLEINKRKACFSEAEIQFFREAVEEGSVGQTHFTDPSPDYRYGCPLRNMIINGETL